MKRDVIRADETSEGLPPALYHCVGTRVRGKGRWREGGRTQLAQEALSLGVLAHLGELEPAGGGRARLGAETPGRGARAALTREDGT